MLKVVVIGAGSSYTPELVEGIIKRYSEFPVDELALVDITEGEKKLNTIFELTKRMFARENIPITITKTLDRREVLEGASFVITQIRVGQLNARILDERIPLKYGILGQETNGAGGMFKALRTIPVVLDIADDIFELCPEAWLINFTNPAGIITEAVLHHSNLEKVIGLCNVPINMKNWIEEQLNIEGIDMEILGLNHHFFVSDVYLKDHSIMNKVLEHYDQLPSCEAMTMKNIMAIPWSKQLIRGLSMIPCPYLSYYFFTKEQLEKQLEQFKDHKVRAEFVKEVECKLFEKYNEITLDVKPRELEERGGAYYSDAACSLMNSLYNDKRDIQYIDTPNNGAIEGYSDSTVFEMASIITSRGPRPLHIGKMPYKIKGTIDAIKAFEKMTIEAAISGNSDIAIAALTLNPLIPSDHIANKVFNDLLEAHKPYLKQFWE